MRLGRDRRRDDGFVVALMSGEVDVGEKMGEFGNGST